MSLIHVFVLGLLLLHVQHTKAAAYTTPTSPVLSPQTSLVGGVQSSPCRSDFLLENLGRTPKTPLRPTPSVTPPPSLNRLELRQRCWNDQGFSVDCAVWTGYRYTWGPASNPYDYWSGAGGRGSDGGGAVSSSANRPERMRSCIAAMLAIVIGITFLL